ncbi:DNA mismatch endonuclease Vsr [bacterium]|nr:MAG: DNA mismatch endonuclease Vsr [bacterium]
MDNLSKADRRKNMQNIRSKNTGIEKTIFGLLKKNKIKYKKHYPVIGKPDVAFPNKKVAVFLDSDFWHGWNFPRWKNKLPKVYWRDKIERNRKRDKSNFLALRNSGWKAIRIWSHEIERNPGECLRKILKALK